MMDAILKVADLGNLRSLLYRENVYERQNVK